MKRLEDRSGAGLCAIHDNKPKVQRAEKRRNKASANFLRFPRGERPQAGFHVIMERSEAVIFGFTTHAASATSGEVPARLAVNFRGFCQQKIPKRLAQVDSTRRAVKNEHFFGARNVSGKVHGRFGRFR